MDDYTTEFNLKRDQLGTNTARISKYYLVSKIQENSIYAGSLPRFLKAHESISNVLSNSILPISPSSLTAYECFLRKNNINIKPFVIAYAH